MRNQLAHLFYTRWSNNPLSVDQNSFVSAEQTELLIFPATSQKRWIGQPLVSILPLTKTHPAIQIFAGSHLGQYLQLSVRVFGLAPDFQSECHKLYYCSP